MKLSNADIYHIKLIVISYVITPVKDYDLFGYLHNTFDDLSISSKLFYEICEELIAENKLEKIVFRVPDTSFRPITYYLPVGTGFDFFGVNDETNQTS